MRTPRAHFAALLLIKFLLVLANPAVAQSAVLGKNCDLRVLGASDANNFFAFHEELKESLTKQDAGKLALLLKYPFRVNDDRGSYYLHNAASFSGRAQEIFTPSVRETILKQTVDAIWCNYSGIMYGDGIIWVNPEGESFAIEAVNIPAKAGSARSTQHPVEFTCSAEKHRVIVDHDLDGNLRYRSWNRGKSLTDKPDLEIAGGKHQFEGTGPCVHSTWRFSKGETGFTVEEIGACDPDTPKDATGRLGVEITGRDPIDWWCH